MPICLVLHEFEGSGPEAEQALTHAVFEVSSSHWRVTSCATLVGTDVSPAYLRAHLLRAMQGAGATPSLMLVAPLPAGTTWHGLPPEGEEWLAGEAAG